MTSIVTVFMILVVLGLAISVLAWRLFQPIRREQQAIDAVRKLAQHELREWSRRHPKNEVTK